MLWMARNALVMAGQRGVAPITFVGASAGNTTTSTDTLAVTMPAGAQVNDLVIAAWTGQTPNHNGVPNDLTQGAFQFINEPGALTVASYRILTAAAPSVSWPPTAVGNGQCGCLLVFRNCYVSAGGSPIDQVAAQGNNPGPPVNLGVAPVYDDEAIVIIGGAAGAVDSNVAAPSGYIGGQGALGEFGDVANATGQDATLWTAYKILVGGADVVRGDDTWSTWTSGSWFTITVSLIPASFDQPK